MAKQQDQSNALALLRQQIREKKTDRVYIFHGEETFLLQHYLGQLKKLLIDELTESFNFHKLTSETFDLLTLADCVENLPMMAQNTMVWVDEIDLFKLPESDREKVAQIISDVPEYCTLVFTYVTTPWKPDKRYKKFYDVIDAHATVVEFEKQSQHDLISWVTRHFTANKKSITPDLCAYLIDITDGTMTSLAAEIGKICAYSGADTIQKTDIDAVTEPVLDALVYQMGDLLGQGKYEQAMALLQKLLKMQNDPIYILGTIGSNFRRMAAAKTLHDRGKGYYELMQLYHIRNDYSAKKIMSSAVRFSARFYAAAAELVMETDRQMKTSFDEPERLLEVLIMRLAQEAGND